MSRPDSKREVMSRTVTKDDRRKTDSGRAPSGDGRRTTPPPVQSKQTQNPKPKTQNRIESHRLIASTALALLLAVSVLGPITPAAPAPAPFLTPRIDGSTPTDERQAFPYLPRGERDRDNPNSTWPDISEVLTFDPASDRVRRAIVGAIYASTSNTTQSIAETGLQSRPNQEQLEGIENTYQEQTSGDRSERGMNGLAAVRLIRALNAPPEQRPALEAEAIARFQAAAGENPNAWQYTYNWSLANLLVGNYTAAYAGMKSVIGDSEKDFNVLPQFWTGLAALRAGDPGEAIVQLTPLVTKRAPEGSNQAFIDRYTQLNNLAREALGDAQWANRNPASAYKTYLDALRIAGAETSTRTGSDGNPVTVSSGNTSNAPYAKWLRLGLQQRGYEGLLADITNLIGASDTLNRDPRLHHDRARLLSFLGRGDEAMGEYRRAVELGEGDAPLLISYGQALESAGDHAAALTQAQAAIAYLGFDPRSVDLKSVARAATDQTILFRDRELAQQLLDANLLRARVFGRQGNAAGLTALVQGITQEAPNLQPNEGGLLLMYGALANEVGGQGAQARDGFRQAWEWLKALPAGVPGRAASLVGLARTTASVDGANAALDALKAAGYDPVSPPASVATDADAPDVLLMGGKILLGAGRAREAANALRVAAVTRNLRDVRALNGIGRPLWTYNGTSVPAEAILLAADAERASGGDANLSLAAMRYKQAYGLAPALAPAWNNLGVLYAERGNAGRADFYLRSSGFVSPNYAWGRHNYATFGYKQGFGSFFAAEEAAGNAVRAVGPGALRWGHDLRYDERGSIPAPSAPANDLLSRLPALAILALLLLHTLVGRDLIANRIIVPTRGVLGRVASILDARFKTPAHGGSRALLRSLAAPAIVGMLGLAWGAGRGSIEVALVFLPVALLAALIAFAANEVGQYVAARRVGVATLHHNWPVGVLLGILSIPFGFMYGWQVNTRIAPGQGDEEAEGVDATHGPSRRRAARSLEERDLQYEALAEAAADEGRPVAAVVAPVAVAAGGGRFGLTTGASTMFVGLAANLLFALIFGVLYWVTGWPSMRLALFAQALVLAFTSVSEPPADGWTLYRRNTPLWLAVFVVAATLVTLLAAGII